MRATDFLHRDHQTVDELFRRLEQTPRSDAEARQKVLDQIADDLEVHSKIEEEIFYPALRRVSGLVDEALEEHRTVSKLVGEVEGLDPAADDFVMKARELARTVEQPAGGHAARRPAPGLRRRAPPGRRIWSALGTAGTRCGVGIDDRRRLEWDAWNRCRRIEILAHRLRYERP